MSIFNLQPKETELAKLADEYWEESNSAVKDEERRTFEAGRVILNGDRSLSSLTTIVHWKSPRIVPHLIKNSEDDLRVALDIAVNHTNVEEALTALTKLYGVGIPVASAILTAIHPDRYTVIDFRALEALGSTDVTFYVAYLDFCRNLAEQNAVPAQIDLPAPTKLRALDRALWQWSKNMAKKH